MVQIDIKVFWYLADKTDTATDTDIDIGLSALDRARQVT